MRQLIFATNNAHKVDEVRAALDGKVDVVTLAEAGLQGEIPETADTLQGNALQKAQWVWERTHTDCFADDTGLEVEALHGAPGVYSARYAGEHCSFDDNIDKLLQALDGQANRRAAFRTVICLIEAGSREQGADSSQRATGYRLPATIEAGSREQGADSSQRLPATGYPLPATKFFEGRVDGQILTERHSVGEGFGYDPVFMPDRFALSFAEMPLEVKNSISHRGLAVKKLVEYLKVEN